MEILVKLFLKLGLTAAVMSVILLIVSGPGTRWGWWPFGVGLLLFAAAGAAGLIAAILCAAGWRKSPPATRTERIAATGTTIGGAVFVILAAQLTMAARKPAIHDVSTDLADPPRFSAVVPLRGPSSNPVDGIDDETAAAQRAAYPALRPLILSAGPDEAFRQATAEGRRMGWTLVSVRPEERVFEATATTRWFGFRDDVVVGVRPHGSGSRIDVRSASRVGKGDAGANAARVARFLERLRTAGDSAEESR